MSLIQMSVSGAVIILLIVVIRALLLHKLPKKAFLFLWGVVLVRLLIPYTLPCSFSAYSLLAGIGAPEISQTAPPADNLTPPPVTNFTPDNAAPFEPDFSPVSAVIPAPDIPPKNGLPFDVRTAVWIAGMVICAVAFTVSYIKCCIRFRESLPVESSYIDQWLSEHKLRRRISVRRSDRIAAPLTYGVFRPVILLPKNYEKIDPDDLKFVLTHEYVHIRRFDAVFKLLLTTALCVHWFNPLVWAMYVIANKDIEISCDEAVITMLGETKKKSYAMTLIRMEEIKSGLTPLISHYSKNSIKERIVSIMKFKKTTALTAAAAAFLAIGITTAFATSAKSPDKAPDSDTVSTPASASSSIDSSNGDTAEDVINLDIGDYDPSLVLEGNRRYEEQKTKYGKLLPNDYTNIPRESTYGIMTDMDNLMVSHMKYINDKDWKPDIYTDSNGEKIITLDYLDMQNAEIVFEDGSAASKNNILPGTSMLVEYNTKDDIYPGIMHCTKIVVMNETPQAPDNSPNYQTTGCIKGAACQDSNCPIHGSSTNVQTPGCVNGAACQDSNCPIHGSSTNVQTPGCVNGAACHDSNCPIHGNCPNDQTPGCVNGAACQDSDCPIHGSSTNVQTPGCVNGAACHDSNCPIHGYNYSQQYGTHHSENHHSENHHSGNHLYYYYQF